MVATLLRRIAGEALDPFYISLVVLLRHKAIGS